MLIHPWYTITHEIKFNYPTAKTNKFRYNHSLPADPFSAFGLSPEFSTSNTLQVEVYTPNICPIFRILVLSQARHGSERIKTKLEYLQADLLHRNTQGRRKKYFTWCFTLFYFWHLRFFCFQLFFVYIKFQRKVQPAENCCPTFTFLVDFSWVFRWLDKI